MMSRKTTDRRPLAALILLVALATALLTTRTALAHADLVSSDPPNGGLVQAMPSQISLQFSEGLATMDARVTDTANNRYDSAPAQIDPQDNTKATIALKSGGGNGIYTATWDALSQDGHDTSGSMFFIVGTQMPTRDSLLALYHSSAPASGPGINWAEAVARFFLFLSLITLAGLPLAIAFIGHDLVANDTTWRFIRRVLIAAALLFIVSATGLALKQLIAGYGLSLHDLRQFTSTNQGTAWTTRWELATVAIFAVIFIGYRWLALTISALTAVGAELSLSLVSHSETLVGGLGPVFFDFLHLFFGALWGGGLILLAVVLPLAFRSFESVDGRLASAAAGRRFAAMAIAGAGFAMAAGLVLAGWHVGAWREFVSSAYGLSLLGKLALLALALGLGAAHRLALVRRMEEGATTALRTFRRSVQVETLAVVGILALSAVLTSAQTGTAAADVARQHSYQSTQTVLGTEVRFAATPAHEGLNVFDATFLRNGSPTDDLDSPSIILASPDPDAEPVQIPLDQSGPGRYSAIAAMDQPGVWFAKVQANVHGQFTAARYSLPDTSAAGQYAADSGFKLAMRLLAVAVAALTIGGLVAESLIGEKIGRASETAES